MKKRIIFICFLFSAFLSSSLHAMPEMAAQKSQEQPPITGTVVEAINSSGYTYLLLEKAGVKEWVAIPELFITVGDEVELQPGVQMGEFFSKPLNKKFDKVIFSGGPTDNFNAKRKVSAHKGVNMSEPAPGNKKKEGKIVEGLKVEKAQADNAYTLEEVMQKRTTLQDKTIIVRGQVVKVSVGIMGRNWVHITDASGDKSDNKLVVTTNDTPSIGDIVTATGTFHNNVDFGGGYYYDIILENATVK